MKNGIFRGEFDDYQYPLLNSEVPPEKLPKVKRAKEKAMEDAIKLAEELKKKYEK